MTREFNKSKRNDYRAPFRNTPTNRQGEERSTRPTRPRLNREMVDRAWENGATRSHADYHPRSSNGSNSRNNWRNNQSIGNSSHSSSNTRKPYDQHQQGGYTRNNDGDRPARRQNSYSRPFETGRSRSEQQHFGTYNNDYGNQEPSHRSQGSRGRRDQQQEHNYAPRRQDRYRGRSGNENTGRFERQTRESNDYQNRGHMRARSSSQETSFSPHRYNRYEGQGSPRNRYEGQGSPRNRYEGQGSPRNRYQGSSSQQAQFEGDYERFNNDQDIERQKRPSGYAQRSPKGRYPDKKRETRHSDERHVTRLQDGRVLKGSRPAQRQKAHFWSEINEDTEQLINQGQSSERRSDERHQPEKELDSSRILPFTGNNKSSSARQSAGRKPASALRREKRTKVEEKKPRSSGPRPSQRGFHWPTS